MKYDIITIGSAVRDIFIFLDKNEAQVISNPRHDPACQKLLALEYGAKINVCRSALSVGGGALNSAVTFSRLGFKAAAAIALGCDDEAGTIVNTMRREKISPALVSFHSRRPTGFSVLLIDEAAGEHVVLVERGANDANEPKFSKIASPNWYFTTAISGERWRVTLEALTAAVKRKNTPWAWNPGAGQLAGGLGALGKYLKYCAVFLLNRDEAIGLLEREGRVNSDNIKYLLGALLPWGPKMVIITDGRAGAYYADQEQMLHIGTDEEAKVVDATGAGDAFGSGFVAGLILTKGLNVEYALRLGLANAESVISQVGAQAGIIYRRDMEKIMRKKRHKIRRLK